MKWLTNLFKPKSPPPPPIEHPIFGKLIGSRALNGQVCSWETAGPIDTPIGPLKVDFQANEDGPTEQQIKLWQEVLGNLVRLRTEAYPFLEGWLETLDPSLRPEDIDPTKIAFWDEPHDLPDWSMEFYYPSRFWRFQVTFENGKAEHTDFDREA